MDGDLDLFAKAGQGFVDRVVDYFEHTVMKAALVRIPDVHVRAFSNALQAFSRLDLRGIVVLCTSVICGIVFRVALRIHIVELVN